MLGNGPLSANPLSTLPSSLAAYTINAEPGSFSLTGSGASTLYGRQVVAGAGSLSVTGANASTLAGRILQSGAGSLTITGAGATLTYSTGATSNTANSSGVPVGMPLVPQPRPWQKDARWLAAVFVGGGIR